MLKSYISGIVFFLTFFIATEIFAADLQPALRLSVQSKVVETAPPPREGVPGNKNTNVGYQIVTIFPDLVSVKDKQSEVIYNFKNRELIYLDLTARTYFITALYAIPTFNTMEKTNQAMMIEGMKATGKPLDHLVEPFDLDMQFGGKYKPADAKGLELSPQKDRGSYKYRGEDVAAFTFSDTEIPFALNKSYSRYLTYQFTLHPRMLEYLKSQTKVIKSLRFTNHGMKPALAEKNYTIADIKQVSEALPVVPSDYTLALPGKEQVLKILLAPPPAKKATDQIASIQKLYGEKKYTEAAIAVIGYYSMYGNDTADKLQPTLAALQKDAPAEARVKEIFMLCAGQPAVQGQDKIIPFLTQMMAYSPEYGYQLSGCLAAYQQMVGQVPQAQATRMAALEKNLALTSVLKDLGDGFYRQYDTFTAWALWNKARALNPAHISVRSIGSLEQAIAKDMPEYF